MEISHSASRWLVSEIAALMGGAAKAERAQAVVTKVDADGTAWVRLSGSDADTPCARTSAAVEPGDAVSVRIAGGRAYIEANYSRPSTDDKTANEAKRDASSAAQTADMARTLAESAIGDAQAAHAAADEAQESAASAVASASVAQDSANAAQASANQAIAEATLASESAFDAANSAAEAMASAISANTSASSAIFALSDVERVIGTLNWIAEHGSYSLSGDTQVVPGKVYYERAGSGTSADPYMYLVVADPQDEDVDGYYVLTVDESVQNYIASHIAQTSYGLDLMVDGSDFRMHIGTVDGSSAMGAYVIDALGNVVASFGSSGASIGGQDGIHLELVSNRLSFLSAGHHIPSTVPPSTGQLDGEVAYIAVDETTNDSIFYMTKSMVVKDLRFGDWQWWKRDNRNMSLKWMGD